MCVYASVLARARIRVCMCVPATAQLCNTNQCMCAIMCAIIKSGSRSVCGAVQETRDWDKVLGMMQAEMQMSLRLQLLLRLIGVEQSKRAVSLHTHTHTYACLNARAHTHTHTHTHTHPHTHTQPDCAHVSPLHPSRCVCTLALHIGLIVFIAPRASSATVFECLICMRFLFLYLHLFSAIEHVSHGKAP